MLNKVKIKEIMTKKVIIVSKNDKIIDVAKLMKKNKIKGVVVTESKEPAGIVTQKDIVYKIIANNKDYNGPIKEIMTNGLITSQEEDTLVNVSKKMYKHNISRVPILDKKGKLVGIVTLKNMIRVYPALLEILREEIKKGTYPNAKVIEGNCESCGNFSESLVELNNKWVCEQCLV